MLVGLPGSRIHAYTGGRPFDAALPGVVFIHGAQHDHSVWILQSRWLAHHGHAVLAVDLPGHGRSDGPVPATVEANAELLAAALEPLANPRWLLVGHSMGGLIALELARRLPARVAGLALLAAAAPMRVADSLLAATRNDPAAAMDMINVWSHAPAPAPFAARPGNPGPGFNVVWQNLRLMQRIEAANGPSVLPTDFAACNGYDGAIDAARALACPVLFLLGSRDQMTPPKAARPLIEACSQAQAITLEGTGHSMMAENPEGVRRALAAFAQRVFAGVAA